MNGNPDIYPTNEVGALLIRAAADVYVSGSANPQIEVLCDSERVYKEEPGQKVARLVAKGDLHVSVPAGLAVRLEHAGGDALLSGLRGRLEIQKVSGDLMIDDCAQVDLASTSGNLTVRKISGALTVQRVGGDLSGEELSGGLLVESAGGDIAVQVLSGPVRLRSGGDIKLNLPQNSADEVTLKAGCSVELLLREDAGARLDLSSGGHDISIEVGGYSASIESASHLMTLGDGARSIYARAGGDVDVNAEPWDEDGISDTIDEGMNNWEERKQRLNFGRGDWGGCEERIRARTEEAARRAEERVREAMERVERQNRHREDLFSRLGINFGFNWPAPPVPPAPPAPPMPPAPEPLAAEKPSAPAAEPVAADSGASTDERTLVLKMLQEHKITIEEAEQLLASLEGNFD